MKHSFKVLLSMKKEPGGQPLFYKTDGQRFKREKTIKLNSKCQYRMDLSFTPPRGVESVNFNGGLLEVREVTRDSTASAYSSFFHTQDFDPTKKGQRREVCVLITLKDAGDLRLTIQLKCYDKDNVQHSEWGSNFHCIEYLCEELADPSAVEVVKETFR
ncbi:CB1 cannabinoid receptor-interacting protein 1-like isoform X2 [Pollicipes pollicipes]|nr:CB1 cannabinoid receptor-interacting protein 1-like isoform X2 [Pollicipes pollicipes]XP_037073602.1 CB1 cannabinoid receptor-interacting protein 1-like isoform X2 [Pollicipes pollicipes]XP_037073603.1 CB1 cannabinoid receptor-interacting protein 1-like isoform X2 [Pollicipes pollicipes]